MKSSVYIEKNCNFFVLHSLSYLNIHRYFDWSNNDNSSKEQRTVNYLMMRPQPLSFGEWEVPLHNHYT